MSRVIVLLENETNRSQFLNEFGLNPPDSTMCRIQTESERRIFRYEVFGLFTMDPKIQDLITEKHGIVIIITNINKQTINRIHQIIDSNPQTSLLLIYEKLFVDLNEFFNMIGNSFLDLFKVSNRKFIFSRNQFSDGQKYCYKWLQCVN